MAVRDFVDISTKSPQHSRGIYAVPGIDRLLNLEDGLVQQHKAQAHTHFIPLSSSYIFQYLIIE